MLVAKRGCSECRGLSLNVQSCKSEDRIDVNRKAAVRSNKLNRLLPEQPGLAVLHSSVQASSSGDGGKQCGVHRNQSSLPLGRQHLGKSRTPFRGVTLIGIGRETGGVARGGEEATPSAQRSLAITCPSRFFLQRS